MIIKNIRLAGRRTSIRLEPQLWSAINEICGQRKITINELCEEVAGKKLSNNFTSALRCWLVDYYRQQLLLIQKAAEEIKQTEPTNP